MTNFGKNSRVNAVVGCADILPPEIEQVRIDGKLGIRLSGNPILDKAILARNGMSADAISGVRRPGYYSVDSGGNCTYMPVYHRTEVEIVKRYNNLTDEERRMHRESAYTRYRDMRIEDMLEAGDALSDTEEDQKLKQEMGDIVERRRKLRERYGRYGNAMKEQEFMNVPAFGGTVREACRAFGIPEAALLRLMYKESGFNPHARPRNSDGSLASSAYGLGQHLNSTWQTCAQTLVPNYAQSLDINALKSVGAIESADELRPPYFDRENPVHQIIATAAYLRHVRDLRGCDWGTAIVFYHTGPYFAQKHVAAALAANDGMIKFNPMLRVSPTLENYLAAARKFYGVDDLGGQQTS
ncbi:MAG TPA: transglycosylase SLT domain-containing protein [bacterium]|nr:transglycosylase SLT domain-containing protein [bacterium]